ncbi:MAG: acyl-CoA dehydrogenase family protein [Candidatus Tectomicrobia bacterium]|nr:acyl-CoA dehydrogenase family protein [Candidatus Tectomicrobia bacterium]
MHFGFSAAELTLRDQVRDFVRREVRPLEQRIEEEGVIPEHLLRRMRELGLFGLSIPAAYGGLELPLVAEILVLEEIATTNLCLRTRITTNSGIGAMGLVYEGSEELKRAYLPKLARGEAIASLALTEPNAGSDAAAIQTRAVDDGDAYVLNGQKIWVSNGPHASYYTILAKTNPAAGNRGMTAFFVERQTPGLDLGPVDRLMGLRGAATCELRLHDCRVPKRNVIGEVNKGFRVAMRALDKGRLGMAAGGLGAAGRLQESCREYAAAQAGKRAGNGAGFGVRGRRGRLAELLAANETEIYALRLLLYTTAARMGRGERCSTEASMAKFFGTEVVNRVADRAVDFFGILGLQADGAAASLVERMYRDTRIMRIYDGSAEIQRLIVARALLAG